MLRSGVEGNLKGRDVGVSAGGLDLPSSGGDVSGSMPSVIVDMPSGSVDKPSSSIDMPSGSVDKPSSSVDMSLESGKFDAYNVDRWATLVVVRVDFWFFVGHASARCRVCVRMPEHDFYV